MESISFKEISQSISNALNNSDYNSPEKMKSLLEKLLKDFDLYSVGGIDFRAVADNIDDSIVITDAVGKYIYVNPAYKENTGISPELIIGKTADEIEKAGTPFTEGTAIDVLRSKKKVYKVSTVNIGNSPQAGFVAGVPIFDENNNLTNVVATSRPIITLIKLKEDYKKFLNEVYSLNKFDSIQIVKKNENESYTSKLVGNSPLLYGIKDTINKAAPTDASVLITGESGVGKEIVADEIFNLSERRNKPFIKVNCASIPANLLESELFGYEKGAFSGANASGKIGLFEAANYGTILLDEIGDMPPDLQVKLLRAIQSKEITRVGGSKSISLDLRFISATNSDLKKKVAQGQFRQDLFYRLNVIPIHVPALRQRKEDIRSIADYFVDIYSKKHKRALHITESQYKILENYSWPGNIRELENVIEYMTICQSNNQPSINDYLLNNILEFNSLSINEGHASDTAYEIQNRNMLNSSLDNYEKELLESVLSTSKNLREAGEKLGVNASTVSRKIRQYNIDYARKRTKG